MVDLDRGKHPGRRDPPDRESHLDRGDYLEQRVDAQLAWLGAASRRNKRSYMNWRLFEIVLGTSITVFSPYAIRWQNWGPLMIALAGGGIAISGSVLALNHSQENWVRYRSLAEQLKREKYLFITGTPPYQGGESQSFHEFVGRFEALMMDERGAWARSLASQENGSSPGGEPTADGRPPQAAGSPAEPPAPSGGTREEWRIGDSNP